jgi:hypothetical protein
VQDEQELRRFAESLIQLVRDRSVAECDRLATGTVAGPTGDRWRDLVAGDAARTAVAGVLPDIVDQVLFALLDAVDNGALPLGWQRADGTLVPLEDIGKGELAGWLVGPDGWRSWYSAARFHEL